MTAPELGKNILLATVTLVLVAALAELTVRALAQVGLINSGAIAFGPGYEEQKSLRSSNPELGWELDPSANDVNADGFRDREHTLAVPAGTVRIVALGDSVAYGQGLARQVGFTSLLEQLLDDAAPQRAHEVLNLGVGGYNTIQEAEQYRVRGRKYSPDLVLLAYVLNDPLPLAMTIKAIAALQKGADSVAGVELAPSATSWSHLARFVGSRVHELRRPDLRAAPRYPLEYHKKPSHWGVVTRGLRDLADQTGQDSTPVVVVIIPMWVKFASYPFMHVHAKVAAEARKHGFAVLDPLRAGAFADTDGLALQLRPGDVLHPNAEGHRRLAASIQEFLAAERYFPTATAHDSPAATN